MVVENTGDDGLIGWRVAFRCLRGGFEQSGHVLRFLLVGGSVDVLTSWLCLRL